MLEGINVLAVSEGCVRGWGISILSLVAILFGLLLIILWIQLVTTGENNMDFIGIIGLVLVALGFLTCSEARVISTYPIYKVTISDTVSLQDFNERYEIISQDGLIYEIKEKRVDTN